jgi:hypothetical protein
MKWIAGYIVVLASGVVQAQASDNEAIDASEALLRSVFRSSESRSAPAAICLEAYVPEHVPLLVERMRGHVPIARSASECRSFQSTESRTWVRLGIPIKETEGQFLQSLDYGVSSNCVFQIRKSGAGEWKVSAKLPCVVS